MLDYNYQKIKTAESSSPRYYRLRKVLDIIDSNLSELKTINEWKGLFNSYSSLKNITRYKRVWVFNNNQVIKMFNILKMNNIYNLRVFTEWNDNRRVKVYRFWRKEIIAPDGRWGIRTPKTISIAKKFYRDTPCAKETARLWREKNYDSLKEWNKEYYKEHKEERSTYHKDWSKKNQDKVLVNRKRWTEKRALMNIMKTKLLYDVERIQGVDNNFLLDPDLGLVTQPFSASFSTTPDVREVVSISVQ